MVADKWSLIITFENRKQVFFSVWRVTLPIVICFVALVFSLYCVSIRVVLVFLAFWLCAAIVFAGMPERIAHIHCMAVVAVYAGYSAFKIKIELIVCSFIVNSCIFRLSFFHSPFWSSFSLFFRLVWSRTFYFVLMYLFVVVNSLQQKKKKNRTGDAFVLVSASICIRAVTNSYTRFDIKSANGATTYYLLIGTIAMHGAF